MLDTHTFRFTIAQPEPRGPAVRAVLQIPAIPRSLSSVSGWEIAFKVQIGKLAVPTDPACYQKRIQKLQTKMLAVEARHTVALTRLPIAQARA